MIAALKAATAVHGKYTSFSTVRPPLQGLNADATNVLLLALQVAGFSMKGLSELLKEIDQ